MTSYEWYIGQGRWGTVVKNSPSRRGTRALSFKISGFLGFEDASIEFDHQLTVLVGANGAGKTSLLASMPVFISPCKAPTQNVSGTLEVVGEPEDLAVYVLDDRGCGQCDLSINNSHGEKRLSNRVDHILEQIDSAARDVPCLVVLIDEVERHLSPILQRQILPRLLKTFPNVQFIVTTHSPQVLASVRSENIRLIDNFKIQPMERATWQRDTNSILESVFGDPGRPPEVAKLLAAIEQAVETDEVEQARELIREFKQKVEGTDLDVLFWEQLLPSGDQ